MKKSVVRGSTSKLYSDNRDFFANLNREFRFRTILKFSVCVCTHYFATGEVLFPSGKSGMSTMCQDQVQGKYLISGDFIPKIMPATVVHKVRKLGTLGGISFFSAPSEPTDQRRDDIGAAAMVEL